MGRAFALHTFTGNLGFALAPPVIALMLAFMDWRAALLLVGLLGVPVVAAILLQSRVLQDQPSRAGRKRRARRAGAAAEPPDAAVLRLLPAVLHGGSGRAVLAGDGARQALGHAGAGRLLGADRLHGRRHGGHPGRRLDRRPDAARPARPVVAADRGRHGAAARCRGWWRCRSAACRRRGVRRPGARHLPHAARRDAEGCLAAGPDRQGVRLRLRRPAARLAPSRRCRSAC